MIGLVRWSVVGWLCLLPAHAVADDKLQAHISADEVIQRMIEMDGLRRNALQSYTSTRLYVAENKRFGKRAEVAVRETYLYPGKKEFTIVSENGSEYVRHKVIDKLIEAEVDSTQAENRDQTRITPENYRFRLSGTELMGDRSCWVVEVIPLHSKKYLLRGRIWVDQEDFAITRLEGSPAKNPSLWTRKVQIERRYQKYGLFWLPVVTDSESDIVIAGKSSLHIDYADYKINPPVGDLVAISEPVWGGK